MNVFRTRARTAGLAAAVAALTLLTAPALAGWGPAAPNFNLEVILRPVGGGPSDGFGHVKFRQPKDADKIVYLDTWVRDLAPNHSYFLQRAVDPNVNDACAVTPWLTLGEVTTDENGTGRAALSRDLAAVPLGKEFDIHFQVIDAVTSGVVLESGCYQFTVSQ
jgi:hypothetical protein